MANSLTCYKYRSGAAALRSLSEGAVYFASPRELNDSLEAKFDIAEPQQYAAIIGKTLNELSSRRGGPSYTLDESAAEDIAIETTQENERFVSECEQVGIFSCAPRPDNQPMWAYYCGNECGVCFHLEWSKEIFEGYSIFPTEVIYSQETRLINRADDVRQALLEVDKQNPTWSLDQLKAFSLTEPFRRRVGMRTVARAVSTKHADWEHEHEIRMLLPRSGPLPLMQKILKSVIYTRTDFPEWQSIVMLLHQLYPQVDQVKMAFSHREPFVTSQLMTTKKVPIGDDADRGKGLNLRSESVKFSS